MNRKERSCVVCLSLVGAIGITTAIWQPTPGIATVLLGYLTGFTAVLGITLVSVAAHWRVLYELVKDNGALYRPRPGFLDGIPYYTCPDCNMTSFNVHDVEYRYCGNCHAFTGKGT